MVHSKDVVTPASADKEVSESRLQRRAAPFCLNPQNIAPVLACCVIATFLS